MLSFSDINPHDVYANIDPSPQGARSYHLATIRDIERTYARSIERANIPPGLERKLSGIVGLGKGISNCLASNLALRSKLTSRAIELFSAMQADLPHRRFFLTTLISDDWLTYDRNTQVFLGRMQATIRPVMALGQFDGWFGNIELQTMAETVAPFGRILMPHAHAVSWSDDPAFDAEEAENRMGSSKRLFSHLGAKTVDVSTRHDTGAANLVAYILKAPSVAKYRFPHQGSPSGFYLRPTALKPMSAVRLLEVLSGIYLDELMLSGGDGSAIRSDLKRYMIECATQVTGVVTPEQVAWYWAKLHCHTGRDGNYKAVEVLRNASARPSGGIITLACNRLFERCLAGSAALRGLLEEYDDGDAGYRSRAADAAAKQGIFGTIFDLIH